MLRAWLRGTARLLLRPLARRVLRLLEQDDAWAPMDPRRIDPLKFGAGSIRSFDWYFEGESTVTVDGIEAIADWLLGCEYRRDSDLFNEPDFWQHPRTFEQLRKGDCEDHALWAWRKLTELGVDAELVVGKTWHDDHVGGHAWVVFERDGERWLFETVAKEKERMIAPLDEARGGYRPEVAVNGNLETRFYTGYAHTVLELLDRERAERRQRLGRLVRRAWPGERMKAWAFWTD